MRRMLILIMVFVVVALFLPTAKAEDTATLGLEVTFDMPLEIWCQDMNGIVVEPYFNAVEDELLEFRLIYEDPNSLNVTLYVGELPGGAEYIPDNEPYTVNHREGTFRWAPEFGQAKETEYVIQFIAQNYEGEQKPLEVKILVSEGNRIISIELTPATWNLESVKLGDVIGNFDESGNVIHSIKNTGNIPVMVDMGYGPLADVVPLPHPGYEQGLDTFITVVGESILPPSERLNLDHALNPDTAESLSLKFGAPTALSEQVPGMGVSYELRAYSAVNID